MAATPSQTRGAIVVALVGNVLGMGLYKPLAGRFMPASDSESSPARAVDHLEHA